VYHLAVFICGTTLETPPESESTPLPRPPLPLPLVSVPYTVTTRTAQFDQVERIPSPDGQWTALLNSATGSLAIETAAGEVVETFPAGSQVRRPTWSPDSRHLLVVRTYFQDMAGEPAEIWQISVAEGQVGQPQRLFTGPRDPAENFSMPASWIDLGHWSPAGQRITFWMGENSASMAADGFPLWVLHLGEESGEAVPLADAALLNPRYQSWAPDGSALAFTAGGYRSAQINKWLNLFDTASGQITTVVSQTEQIPGIVAWSPRGDPSAGSGQALIAYAAVPAGETGRDLADWMSFENAAIAGRRVYLLDPATGQHWRLNDVDAFQDAPTWSKDGETVYYVQREEDTMALMAADPATGQAQVIEGSRRPAPGAVGYYGQSKWDDLLAYRPDAPRAEVSPLVETYTDPTHGYTLGYPTGWHLSQGWQSLYGWHEMPTLSSYPPDGPAPDLGPFSGQALIAIQAIAVPQGDIGALLKKALASPGPDQIQTLVPFDQREMTMAGQPAIRLETMGEFGSVNHVLLVLDGTWGYILRGRGDRRVFDTVAGSLQFKQESGATPKPATFTPASSPPNVTPTPSSPPASPISAPPFTATPPLPSPTSVSSAPANRGAPQIIDFAVTPTNALTVGNVISLSWQAIGEQAEICFISGYPIRCRDVPLMGSQAITVDETMLAQAIGGVGLRITTSGVFTWSIVPLDFQCRVSGWFFDNPPSECPEAEAVYSHAAAQYFEHGFMLWTEQPDRFYVFFDEGHEFIWSEALYTFETPTPVETATPPPGYSEPVSGFGRVWRGEISGLDNVRQPLGWATGPEFAFETAYQCRLATAYYRLWACYLLGPGGKVLYLHPDSSAQVRFLWEEK
jgi:hypothetical protein